MSWRDEKRNGAWWLRQSSFSLSTQLNGGQTYFPSITSQMLRLFGLVLGFGQHSIRARWRLEGLGNRDFGLKCCNFLFPALKCRLNMDVHKVDPVHSDLRCKNNKNARRDGKKWPKIIWEKAFVVINSLKEIFLFLWKNAF